MSLDDRQSEDLCESIKDDDCEVGEKEHILEKYILDKILRCASEEAEFTSDYEIVCTALEEDDYDHGDRKKNCEYP